MRPLPRTTTRQLWGIAVAASLAVLAVGCGNASKPTQAEREVRALVAAVGAQAQSHEYARICADEMWGVLRQVDHLIGGNCAKDLAREWAEGVQLQQVAPDTQIILAGNTAAIVDGSTADHAIRIRGRWLLAELPRNKRHARPNEVTEVLAQIENGSAVTINRETGALERAAGASGGRTEIEIPTPAGTSGRALEEYEAGKLAVAQSGCLACHRIGANGNDGPGPDLSEVAGRLPRQAIAQTLIHPTAPMPSFKNLPPAKFHAIVTFLAQLK